MKKAVIVGVGTRGSMGFETRKRLLAEGWKVFAMDSELQQRPPGTIPVDVLDLDETAAAFARVGEGLDALVYCAGYNRPTELDEDPLTVFHSMDHHFKVNTRGAVLALQHFRRLRNPKRSIAVLIGSNSAHVARSSSFAYSASKSGLAGLTRGLARDLAADRLAVVQLDFGIVKDSPMTARSCRQFGMKWEKLKYRQRWPLDLTAEEAARWIAFVAANGHFATGNCLKIDGAEA